MANIKAFRALRPAPEYAGRCAALPYDVYNRQEARVAAACDPLSFLNIDRPETQFPADHDIYAPEVYAKAAQMLKEQREEGIYRQDDAPCYYLYEMTMLGRSQTGIVACASVDDYLGGVIKKHENTREDKEQDRIRHVDTCSAQTGPIFLAYRAMEKVSALTARIKETERPLFDFISEDGIGHRGWQIEQAEDIALITESFLEIPLYIADGHHRAASAVKVALKRRAEHPDYTGEEAFNYFLSVLFPDNELQIMDYNRVVRDLNGLSAEAFLQRLCEVGELEKADHAVKPAHPGQFGVYLEDQWFTLTLSPAGISSDPVEGLDVSLLQTKVLQPILGIEDPRTDRRIDFIGGIRGLEELERRVHSDCVAAFSLYPTSIAQLFAVADAGRLMPPKSTWFEPKIRSGLFIHLI